ncbi:MAG: DeoR/GlpR transcriptional regulator [Ruminococcaceae bacterium]|nr:DeoR/GlpR transcriptional regulator [Oscillospiraceae bacterium]
MSITVRQKQILDILSERIFITVEELSKLTFTSSSSIRRDLTYLQNNGLVKRSHGGVSLPEPLNGVASFYDRTRKSIKEKRLIAQKASVLLQDGQSIILDSSSTASFLLPYIAKKKGVTVFTNNLSTAISAIELGINTHSLGGSSANGSLALSGAETYTALSNIRADILFFSSQSINSEGVISDSTEEENYVRLLMLKSANKSVFLCDSKKFDTSSVYRLCNINDVDVAVFDSEYKNLNTICNLL